MRVDAPAPTPPRAWRCDATRGPSAGDRWKDLPEKQELKGNNDLLVFTKPETIKKIHRNFFAAGADICEILRHDRGSAMPGESW